MRRSISALGAAVALFVAAAPASGAVPAPSVALDRSSIKLGDRIVVTLHDWPQNGAVVVSVCGNLARRGSVDCNLADSQGIPVTRYVPPVTELVVSAPPTTCPCVIRAANNTQDIVAYAPIAIAGVPVGPVVGAVVESPLSLNVQVHRVHAGLLAWLRSSLGGPTQYDLTVAVRNKSPEDLPGLRLLARAGRTSRDQARIIEIKPPDVLGAGQSWKHTQRVQIAAPVLGRFVWTVSASGAGPSVSDEAVVRHVPVLLLLLIAFVVGVITAMVVRWVRRRRARRGADAAGEGLEPDGPALAPSPDTETAASSASPARS